MKNKYPNEETLKAFLKSYERPQTKENIMVSISGGADSDIMLDLLLRMCDEYKIDKNKFHFVFFETGIEYQATRNHLDDLEKKYGITIERQRAYIPVPMGCKKFGIPFISKFISQMIERLQNHNFDFKNDGWKSFEELKLKYPGMVGALTWWCNAYPAKEGKKSMFNINNNKFLKEFMIENPPEFKISAKCCDGAKKKTSKNYEKTHCLDCKCVGLRKTEGGLRSASVKNCWTDDVKHKYATYRPIFWFTDKDKQEYKEFYGLKYSDCYEVYGMKRTGCFFCPFNSKAEEEYKVISEYEPRLAKAADLIFGPSYEYKKKYLEYRQAHLKKNLKKGNKQNETSSTID